MLPDAINALCGVQRVENSVNRTDCGEGQAIAKTML